MSLVFDSDVNIIGTHLIKYLYMDPFLYQMCEKMSTDKFSVTYNYDPATIDSSLSFEKIVACLYEMSGQPIFQQGDDYKMIFCVNGTYDGEPFTLYDWKGDRSVHIGGSDRLNVDGLIKELLVRIMITTPKKFNVQGSDGNIYKFR